MRQILLAVLAGLITVIHRNQMYIIVDIASEQGIYFLLVSIF